MDPEQKRDPDSEETEIVDDSNVEMIEEELSDRDTIPPPALSEDELEEQREAEFEALLKRGNKPPD